MSANDIVKSVMADTQRVESISLPPFATGQGTKYILLEDLRGFLCTAISTDLNRRGRRNQNTMARIAQELVVYYHILGYSDTEAQAKIVAILEDKEEFDGE